MGKGDLRFNFLNPEHAHHAYYLRKLNLYVDMWASKSQATDEQDKENSQGSSGHEVEDQHLKNERRKKAALFLNKLRQSKSSGAGTIAEVKTDDDSTKESEAAVSRSSSSPDQAKQNQSNHSDDVEIIGSVARDSSPRRLVQWKLLGSIPEPETKTCYKTKPSYLIPGIRSDSVLKSLTLCNIN